LDEKTFAVKKWILIFLPVVLFSLRVSPQMSDSEIVLLKKLDSVKNSSSVSKYFADLYFNTTIRAVNFFQHKEQEQKNLIVRFETRFAGLFFKAAEAYSNNDSIPKEWEAYFDDSTFSPLVYKLFGINAHINGDIWQALTAEFNLEELEQLKKSYSGFQKALAKQFREFFQESYADSREVRRMHYSSAGLEKLYGKWMLTKWRKRQYRIAMLFYSDPEQFKNELIRLNKKMEHINDLIFRYLTPGFVIFATRKK
jgi:hypothetical protein